MDFRKIRVPLPGVEIVDKTVVEDTVCSSDEGIETIRAPGRGGDVAGQDAAVFLRQARSKWRRLASADGQPAGGGAPVTGIGGVTHELAGDPTGGGSVG